MSRVMNELVKNDQYNHFIEECKAIITEAVFVSRWALVEGYWMLGRRIAEEAKTNTTILESFADLQGDLGISQSTLYRAHQAYVKFPDIDKLPEGKNITWSKLVSKYLPVKTEVKEAGCDHRFFCTKCGERR